MNGTPEMCYTSRTICAQILLIVLLLPLTACGLFANKEMRTLRKIARISRRLPGWLQQRLEPDADKRHDDTIVRDDQQYKDNSAYHVGWDRGLQCLPQHRL